MAKAGVGILEMNRDRIMDTAANSFSLQVLQELVALLHPNGVDVVDMLGETGRVGSDDPVGPLERLIVACSVGAPRLIATL